jgi:hypothetical protein
VPQPAEPPQQPQQPQQPPGLLAGLQALLRRLLDRWYLKALAVVGALLALSHAVINLQVVPSANRHYMPQWTAAAQQLLHRQVRRAAAPPPGAWGPPAGAQLAA